MKRGWKILLIFLSAFIILFTVGRLTNTFRLYTTATVSNEPNLKRGERLFASNFVAPELFDYICFLGNIPGFERQTTVFRICGLPGAVVEMKAGDLFINDVAQDKKLNLLNHYIMTASQIQELQKEMVIEEEAIMMKQDSFLVLLESELVRDKKISAKRYVLDKDQPDTTMERIYQKKWNADHFGPLKIPAGNYFVLGDNRHNAYDSRYAGLVEKSDVIATVLLKN